MTYQIVIPMLLLTSVHMAATIQTVSHVQKCRGVQDFSYRKEPAYVNCPEEETVNFSGLKLKRIPENFVSSKSIRNVLLDRNDIRAIPRDTFKNVASMQCLNLARNQIPMKWLKFEHDNLRTLILDHQIVTESDNMMGDDKLHLADLVSNYPNLETLSINGIDEMDVIFTSVAPFPRLTTIYATDAGFTYVADSLFRDYSELRVVHLEGNKIEEIELRGTENLEALYLDRNPIQSINIDSFNRSLQVLSLSGCLLKQMIPISVSSLITLDLSSNQITDESEHRNLQSLPSLENLILNYNQLSLFPDFRHFKRLKVLLLSYNQISTIPYHVVPHQLKILSLKGNQLSAIETTTFSNLEQLEELDLSMNLLVSLPVGWQKNLKMLRYLNLETNRFTAIEYMEIGTSWALTELCVRNNAIKGIDLNSLQLVPSQCTVFL
ncbi:PREDICTED: leucine-rich repeat-containing G-protein coupled receptor 5-like [Habropoda laboriosa]|uniref:leucine-rich repeat-containing G-protein coupled receptor 5-like n=1 Tax=Habropoda laboriosa TaxID=597456 RepID=UPI00083D43CC|nr:PREDICTED: leucine-rich repeat-containing G-protein coupled receptor 5-like [Habropoda laboriosa]